MDTEKLSIQRFKGEDFSVFKVQFEALLISRKLQGVLQKSMVKLTDAEKQAREKKDKQVKSMLLCALDNKYVKSVMSCTTSVLLLNG